MSNFVLVYTGGATPDAANRDAIMAEWGAWYGKMGESIVDGGKPFGASKTVGANGVTDGAASSPAATGYTVIAADSIDAVTASVKDHPHIKHGGQVSVYETFEM